MFKLKHYIYILKFIALIAFFNSLTLQAKDVDFVELQSRATKNHINYKLNNDFTLETETEFEMQLLNEQSLEQQKKMNFSYSTSIEKFDVIEAYTLKADGNKVSVPENNYQVNVNKGHKGKGPVFSDRTRITVVFPDLEVNDSIHIKTLRRETEPMFPGHFGISGYFWSQMAFDDVRVTFNLPKNLDYIFEARGMAEESLVENGRKLITLAYKNPKPVKEKRIDFSVWNEEEQVGYAISTFKDYATIAQAYAMRAAPKAVPTPRVKQLAKEIVGTEKDKLTQAKLLYNWVATEITYAGNCIGVGAVVPHDTDFILDNRMGDCKDHATLLEALLTTQGIKSTQALINSGSRFTLPEIPLVTSVNHVINYLPEWDKYVDSTSATTPFDLIPLQIAGKPVILVEGHKDGLKTPRTVAEQTYQLVEAELDIAEDGTLSGNIALALKGYPAVQARASWRNVTEDQEKEWLERTFSSRNALGKGYLKKDDPMPLSSNFNFSVEFERPEFINSKGAGAFYIGPPMQTATPIYAYTDYPKEPIEGYEIVCGNGISEEKITYKFPDDLKILAKPESFEIEENYLLFKANYSFQNNVMTVHRKIEDRTPGHTCSAELMNKQRETLIKINENLSSQVIYQH